jgi:uncharacterized membrane protein YoaK (UPF0700 family)
MDESKIEATALVRILRLVDGAKRAPEKHNWLITICIWLAAAVGAYFVTSRLGATAAGRTMFVIGAFVAGVIAAYAVLNAWQSALWKYASRYLDADEIQKRISELQ